MDKKKEHSQALVAHAYNPNYSGGRDQEDQVSKPAQTNSSGRPYLQNTHHKKGVGPEFKPQYHKKKKRRNNIFGFDK
jgi:hypothetical protein